MDKVLIIDGNPIIGLTPEQTDAYVLNALHNGLSIHYDNKVNALPDKPLMGFVQDDLFYEWTQNDVCPDKLRSFIVWDIVGDKLYNPIKTTTLLAMRRGKLYMNIDNKWLRANLIRANRELTKDV